MRRLVAGLVLAGLVLVTGRARAQTYVRTLVPDRTDLCVVWPGREYTYQLDAAGSSRTPGDTEFAAVDAAVASWRAVSATCSDYAFTRGPDIQDPQVGYDKDSKDNQNVITFREADCADVVPTDAPCMADDSCANVYKCWEHGSFIIALTTTTFSFRTGYIVDADIELNASSGPGRGFLFTTVDSPPCGWSSDPSAPCVSADIQNTLTHELGHVVGLDHVYSAEAAGATMEATAPPGETHKRIIDAGSAEGFCLAYPRGLPPTQCGESPTLGRHFQAVSVGTGCGAAPGAPGLAWVLLVGWGLGRRRARATPAPRG